MTKKEWLNIWKDTRVKMTIPDVVWDGENTVYKDKLFTGTVIRLNSNRSQALVKWDDTGSEIWYGRLGVELETTLFFVNDF